MRSRSEVGFERQGRGLGMEYLCYAAGNMIRLGGQWLNGRDSDACY